MSDLIQAGSQVTLHFSLSLTDGALIDSNFEKEAASFRVGDGSLLPEFEKRLIAMSAGQQGEWLIPAAHAFGESNPENIHRIEKNRFGSDADTLEVGVVIAFAGAGKQEVPGVIREIAPDHLLVDFNHPLAGRDILFRAKVVSVVNAGPGDSALKFVEIR
ncbi:MAG: peptidylprolyl isomerase [Pseudomonadales bacterium]|nr:peptidylprolyl isomerase [Pseudomonadales bacterium]